MRAVSQTAWQLYRTPRRYPGQLAQATALRVAVLPALACRLATADQVVLVHQMGKVGSRAIVDAIERSVAGVTVFHSHRLNLAVRREERALRRHGTWSPPKSWVEASVLARVLPRWTRGLTVITVVRNPVDRGVSAFLQEPWRYVPELGRGGSLMKLPRQRIVDCYERYFPHEYALDWLDLELRDVFGVDLYDIPFGGPGSYIETSNHGQNIYCFRYEELAEAFRLVSTRALGKTLELGRVNTAEGKGYNELRKHLRATAKLPADVIGRIEASRLVKHFYGEAGSGESVSHGGGGWVG